MPPGPFESTCYGMIKYIIQTNGRFPRTHNWKIEVMCVEKKDKTNDNINSNLLFSIAKIKVVTERQAFYLSNSKKKNVNDMKKTKNIH